MLPFDNLTFLVWCEHLLQVQKWNGSHQYQKDSIGSFFPLQILYPAMTKIFLFVKLHKGISLEKHLNERIMFFLCKIFTKNFSHLCKLISFLWEQCNTCFGEKKPPDSLVQRNMGASEWIYQLDAMSL